MLSTFSIKGQTRPIQAVDTPFEKFVHSEGREAMTKNAGVFVNWSSDLHIGVDFV